MNGRPTLANPHNTGEAQDQGASPFSSIVNASSLQSMCSDYIEQVGTS